MRLHPNSAALSPILLQRRTCLSRGFTLLEMLVVLIIIALLAALALPAIRGHSESVAINAACHQLVEDLSFARQKAISQRSTVALVFISPDVFSANVASGVYTQKEKDALKRLQGGVFTHYAVFQYRKVGEQPGSYSANYITEWKSLPDKTFIDTNAYDLAYPPAAFRFGPAFSRSDVKFPFPFSSSPQFDTPLPYIAFDSEGRCIRVDREETGVGTPITDLDIPVARGGILFTRENDGSVKQANYDAQQIPPYNGTNNIVHIDFLTGRAKRVELELK